MCTGCGNLGVEGYLYLLLTGRLSLTCFCKNLFPLWGCNCFHISLGYFVIHSP